jgi:trans-2,3-dihydro-3-hydroxyanthranilate isomerase
VRDCHLLRVFTRGDDGGNHLGVVTDLSGLDGGTMQEIAALLGFSETVFLDGVGPAAPRVRIFTPTVEIPFAGHPLVGAGWLLGTLGEARRLVCDIGEVPFRVAGDSAWIEVALAPQVEEVAPDAAVASGLPEAVWARMVGLPLRYLLLEVSATQVVAEAHPDMAHLAQQHWEGTLLFARSGGQVKARFFAPAAGVPEDPATGSAAVALASALSDSGEREGSVVVDQGDEVGAGSRLLVTWGGNQVAVGGQVRRDGVRSLPL